MAQDQEDKPAELGLFARKADFSSLSLAEIIAMALSAVWLLGVTVFFIFASGGDEGPSIDTLRFVITLIAIFMPVALIWVAATAVKSSRILRDESQRLQAAIDALRHAYIQQQQSGIVGMRPQVEQKLEEIVAAQKKTDATLAMFTSIRPESREARIAELAEIEALRQQGEDPQTALALGTPAEALQPPLPTDELIRALNFPESTEDKEGFRALRKALRDRSAAQLIHAAQDVLTLLSQDGIYMDDLKPELARPEIWRRFATGERGRTVSALGGIRDRTSLALTTGRMRQDTIFRDSAHHFLRKFDQMFSEFENDATDAEIAEMTNTRSGRAFMLLGRVMGTFE